MQPDINLYHLPSNSLLSFSWGLHFNKLKIAPDRVSLHHPGWPEFTKICQPMLGHVLRLKMYATRAHIFWGFAVRTHGSYCLLETHCSLSLEFRTGHQSLYSSFGWGGTDPGTSSLVGILPASVVFYMIPST